MTAKERGGRAAGCLTSESARKGSSGRRSIPCANYYATELMWLVP